MRRRSITGYIVCLAGAPIAWRSHLQDAVADSPNVTEYIGIFDAATATLGIQNLLVEIGMDVKTPIIYEDNDGARRLATDGMGKKKARHIEMKYHVIQDICREGKVSIKRLPGKNQPADLLTKGTQSIKTHRHLWNGVGLVNPAWKC